MVQKDARNDDEHEPRPLDMSGVEDRTKGMLDAELIFSLGSYMVEATALAVRKMIDLTVDLGRGNGLPGVLALHDMPEEPENVAAQPVLARAGNTILVRSYPKTGKVRLDMRRFILLRRLFIPYGHRAYVPIVRRNVPKVGEALVFLFSEMRFVAIDPQRTRKSNNSGSAKKPAAETEKAKAPEKKPKDEAAGA